MLWFDPTYLLFLLPGLALALWAQFKVKSTFAKFARVPTRNGVTGLVAAQALMQRYGMGDVKVVQISGELTDHYNPQNKSMSLSQSSVMNSVASVAVVAHELGHAMQDQENYAPLRMRAAIVPAVQIGGWVGPLIMTAGMIFSSANLIWVGIIAFGVTAAFALVTLPVEFDASNRALRMLNETGLLASDELGGAHQVLNAAALTYVAAAAQAILQLLYFVMRFGGLGRRNDD